MGQSAKFSRRERQIMDVLYAKGGATVMEICRQLPDPPTDMAIRRLVHILEEKGHVKRRMQGREYLNLPRQIQAACGSLRTAARARHKIFNGALDEALAAHLAIKEDVSQDQLERMIRLILSVSPRGPVIVTCDFNIPSLVLTTPSMLLPPSWIWRSISASVGHGPGNRGPERQGFGVATSSDLGVRDHGRDADAGAVVGPA